MQVPDKLRSPEAGDLVQVSDCDDPCCGLKAVVLGVDGDTVSVAFLVTDDEPVDYLADQVTKLFFIKIEFPPFLGADGRRFMRITDQSGLLNVSSSDFGMAHLEALIPLFKGMAPVNDLGHPAKKFYLLAYVMADGNLGFDGNAVESIEDGW